MGGKRPGGPTISEGPPMPRQSIMRYDYSISLAEVKANRRLRDVWASYLDRFPWAWFATLQFETELKSFTARRRLENWLTTIERKVHRAVPCFIAEEFTDTWWTPHYHLLMGNVGDLRRDYWWGQWYHRKGNGCARILPYRADRGVEHYVSKYIVKDEYIKGCWYLRRLDHPDKCKDWVGLPPQRELPAEAEKVVERVVAMFDGKRHLVKP